MPAIGGLLGTKLPPPAAITMTGASMAWPWSVVISQWPFVERVFAGVPELDYVKAQHAGTLPPNVEITEFFFLTGAMLNNVDAQRHYINSNYTHAARDVFNHGCNVVAQMICKREGAGGLRYSLSCNPDTGPEVIRLLEKHAIGRAHV